MLKGRLCASAGGLPRDIIELDSQDKIWRWFWRPQLLVLLGSYILAQWRLYKNPKYEISVAPILHENHLGNYAIFEEPPEALPISIHMAMALFWIAGTIIQKELVGRMFARDSRSYRTAHAMLGTTMCVFGVIGSLVGGYMAWKSHAHTPMRWFLMLLPIPFLFMIGATYVTAAFHKTNLHRFFATCAFVGPSLASLWAETLIWVLGRHTPLGPWRGELVGTFAATLIMLALIHYPAWKLMQTVRTQNEMLTAKQKRERVTFSDDRAKQL